MARLEFDSFRQPLLAGIRDDNPSSGRFVFREGKVLVDVLVESDESMRASLTGQILDPNDPSAIYAGRPVVLVHETDEIARTSTNPFGEFNLDFRANPDLLLVVHLEPRSVLVSALPPLPVGY